MPLEAPSNCWTHAEAAIAAALANSAQFQAMTGTGSAEAAAAFVYGEQLDEPLLGGAYELVEEIERHAHIAQVYSAREAPYSKRRLGNRRYEAGGTCVVYLERRSTSAEFAPGTSEVPQSLQRKWKNRVGAILDEVLAYLDTAGGPWVQGFDVTEYGTNAPEQWADRGLWQGAESQLTWGIES